LPPPNVDYSTLGWRDAADIALQRTNTLIDLPLIGNPGFSLWGRGMPALLYLEAMVRRKSILRQAVASIEQDYLELRSFLGDVTIQHMVDIGCGHAVIDVFFYRDYGATISLVDIERTSEQHHDFRSTGAGYTSLLAARRLLVANGVPDEAVSTTNPRRGSMPDAPADLIISLLSAGFHYPISEYLPFARNCLRPGGTLIFDARSGAGQLDVLAGFQELRTIRDHPKYRRVAAIR
jgi:hypothetical protein